MTISSPNSQTSGSLIGITSIPIDQSGCRSESILKDVTLFGSKRIAAATVAFINS